MSLKARVKQWAEVRRELLLVAAGALLLLGVAVAAGVKLVKPAPPSRLVVSVPDSEGGARYYARKYKEVLARDGITLEVRESRGAPACARALQQPGSDVDAAFLPSTTAALPEGARAVSLGSLAYVPLWIFHRGEQLEDLGPLSRERLSVGPEGSSTRELSVQLLQAAGVDVAGLQLLDLDRDAAAKALEEGTVDAVFLLAPAESPAVRKMAMLKGVTLVDLARAEAYARRIPQLQRLVLPRGVLDLPTDVPARDVALLAPTSHLVVRESLHPALVHLLLKAATEVHGSAGLLDRSGEFPAPREGGFPLSADARRYYQSGGTLLQRFLPFWAANLVDRLWLTLVPVLAVLVPLARTLPPLYRWRVRSRVFRFYARLKELELELERRDEPQSLSGLLADLERLDAEVAELPVPLSHADQLYVFREHVHLLRRRVRARLQEAQGGAGAPLAARA
ncbi:MAG: hypothetical protein RL653_4506 [Pseudomonadota bacterium]|jgi:TRAP-type uncharacterized transport system substrate-binding protein